MHQSGGNPAHRLCAFKGQVRGKKIVTLFYMVTMFFGGGLIPTYLVIRNLHMLNTIWALVLPGCLSVYNMICGENLFQIQYF